MISRHGARYPTASRSAAYNKTIAAVHKATSYGAGYEVLKSFVYTLGADDLTDFGRQELVKSGVKFYNRYEGLTNHFMPFIRASGQHRVVESAQKWAEGYHNGRLADGSSTADDLYPYPIAMLSEDEGQNNTLNHDRCDNFEKDPRYNTFGGDAQKKFLAIFIGDITARLNANLPGANLSSSDAINIMDLCPFVTVAKPLSSGNPPSPFCALFTQHDWINYDYYQTLGKYYGHGNGNPLGPTQGVGYVNELLARMTGQPVMDHTSVNQTLDSHRSTFPLGRPLYADFSHDNDMTGILSALGLYNSTPTLSQTLYTSPQAAAGYSAAWTVSFAARAYFEKMRCNDGTGYDGEYVRILVNDRVVPMPFCGSDQDGKCKLDAFVQSQSFARDGGLWDQLCFNTTIDT